VCYRFSFVLRQQLVGSSSWTSKRTVRKDYGLIMVFLAFHGPTSESLLGIMGWKRKSFIIICHPMICATFCVRLPWRFHKQSFDKIYIHENDNYLLPLFISMGNTHDAWSWRDNIYSNIILINFSWVWLLYRHFKDCEWPFFKKK